MNVGKTLFAQVMEFVPWKTFGRIIERHKGDAGVRTLDCADLFRVMAFAQLTWRESLRDVESCPDANEDKRGGRVCHGSWVDLDLAQHSEFSVFIGSSDDQLSLTNQL